MCVLSFRESSEEIVAAVILSAELERSYEILKGLCDEEVAILVVSCVYMTSVRPLPAERRLSAFALV